MADLKAAISRHRSAIVQYRRDLHRIPEPAYSEARTSAYVAEALRRYGLEVRTGVARFGVVADKVFSSEGRTLMLRSELDALPVTEETGLTFASTHPGAMHACGHDGHMAMVLGAAAVLSELDSRLAGRVRYVFQPAEEGPGGAKPMIEAGVMADPTVDYVLGCHLWPALPEGVVGIRPGPAMAAMDWFDLKILGRGGHGAMPHLCVDALEIGTQVVGALQRIVSRQMNPLFPTVVTVGQFQGGTTYNTIPGEVCLRGTTRTYDPATWQSWKTRIETVVAGVCSAMGAEYELAYQTGYPVTVNDVWMAEQVRSFAAAAVGPDNLVIPERTMGGEDMAFYLERARGCFFFLGVGRENCAPLHHPCFDFNEEVLLAGVEIYCRAALKLLGQS